MSYEFVGTMLGEPIYRRTEAAIKVGDLVRVNIPTEPPFERRVLKVKHDPSSDPPHIQYEVEHTPGKTKLYHCSWVTLIEAAKPAPKFALGDEVIVNGWCYSKVHEIREHDGAWGYVVTMPSYYGKCQCLKREGDLMACNPVQPAPPSPLDTPAKPFLASYKFNGFRYSVRIMAADFADAEARCKQLNLDLDGKCE